jgi:hypothetical protein
MSIIQLVKYFDRETIAVLRVLLSKALKGELRGLALCYRTQEGQEESVFTGIYRVNEGHAMAAARRLSRGIHRAHDSAFVP